MKTQRLWLVALLVLGVTPTLAAQKTVVLAVPGMRCAACPITVRKALTQVDGVVRAEVDYDKRQATVCRHILEKLLQCLESACRSANAYYWKLS